MSFYSNELAVDVVCAPQMSLAGKTLCFTGTLTSPRADCTAQAQAAGAGVTATVTGKTTHLVAGPGAGSKLSRAAELGVEVVDEAVFIERLEAMGVSL